MPYLRISQNKTSGFTMVEVLVAAFLLSVILAALFLTLNTGHLSTSLGLAKIDLQASVRQAVDIISKDARQTFSYEIADEENAPSQSHIKFRQVQGWNTVSDTPVFSSNFIDYNYDAVSNTIRRNVIDPSGGVLETRQFNNIVAAPFYAVDFGSGETVPLTGNVLLTSSRLVVIITGQARLRKEQILNFSLTEQVKIRNE